MFGKYTLFKTQSSTSTRSIKSFATYRSSYRFYWLVSEYFNKMTNCGYRSVPFFLKKNAIRFCSSFHEMSKLDYLYTLDSTWSNMSNFFTLRNLNCSKNLENLQLILVLSPRRLEISESWWAFRSLFLRSSLLSSNCTILKLSLNGITGAK